MKRIARLHRDDPTRREPAEPAQHFARSPAEVALARGHLWLRFPPELEALFNADTLEPRRRLLVSCALLGCLGVLIGSTNVNEATPEIASLVWQLVWVWMGLALGGLLLIWLSPPQRRRAWHAEGITALLATAMCLLVTWMATASRADTAITHSAMASIPVLYSCIAARLRFDWSLGSALISFGAYAWMVTGHTPEQAQLAQSFKHVMALSYAFALMANYAFEHSERRNWLLRQVATAQREALIKTSAQLHQLSIQDPLTGLHNRRQFDINLRQAIVRASQLHQPLALLAIDVDFFKRYNDSHGHPAGDTCLSDIARILATQAKVHGGMVARLGGEEFALILPAHHPEQALRAAQAVCRAVSAVRIPHQDSSVADHVTISVGVAHWREQATESPKAMQERADRALYQAKAQGRNRVEEVLASDQPEPADEAHTHMRHLVEADETEHDADDQVRQRQQAKEDLCRQTLAGRFHWLRFPRELELDYIAHQAEPRRKVLLLTAMVGLLIYNLFSIGSWSLFPDIQPWVLNVQVWVSAGVLVAAVVTYFLPRPLWREGLHSLGTSVVALVSTWILSQSHLTSTLSYAVCLMLIPMFSGVGSRQPFWFTFVPAVITSVAAAVLLQPVGPVQRIVYGDSLFMIVNNMAYILILAYTLEHGTRKEWLLARIDGIQRDALMAASQRLKTLAVVDPLTGVSNRRQFDDDLQRIWRECEQDQRSLGLLIIDVDHFKPYNDQLGHLAGDECLRQVAGLISETAQADKALVARLGGEEFGVLLPGGGLEAASQLAERIRLAVSHADIPHDFVPSRHVTISLGVASVVPRPGMDRMALFASADKALYEAKRAGRNRVVAPPPTPSRENPPLGFRHNATP